MPGADPATAGVRAGAWPYPVAYGKENAVEADVLILGGGVAGCHAAIAAAKRGAKVVVVDKGPIIRSDSGGAGVDHWHGACTNPCSTVPPDEMIELTLHGDYLLNWEFGNGITSYILLNESYDALLDVEQWGVRVRDVYDELKGAEYRDEKTKLISLKLRDGSIEVGEYPVDYYLRAPYAGSLAENYRAHAGL